MSHTRRVPPADDDALTGCHDAPSVPIHIQREKRFDVIVRDFMLPAFATLAFC